MINEEDNDELWLDLKPLAERGSGIALRYDMLETISCWIHGGHDWKRFASHLGISDISALNFIDYASSRYKNCAAMMLVFEILTTPTDIEREFSNNNSWEFPTWLKQTLTRPSAQFDLKILLETLHKEDMFDVLQRIHEKFLQELNDLILTRNTSTRRLGVDFPTPNTNYSIPPDGLSNNYNDPYNVDPDSGVFSSSGISLESNNIDCFSSISSKLAELPEFSCVVPPDGLDDRGIPIYPEDTPKPIETKPMISNNKPRDTKGEEITKSKDDKMVVFVLYMTEDGTELANETIKKLAEQNILCLTLQILENSGLLNLNPTDVIDEYIKQAEYVIPVLTPMFLKEVKLSGRNSGSMTRYIFQKCSQNFPYDNCINFDCKPVMSQHNFRGKKQMMEDLRHSSPIIRNPLLMPKQFTMFVNILRNTKKWKR